MAQQGWQHQQAGAYHQSGGPGYYATPGLAPTGRQPAQPAGGGGYQAAGVRPPQAQHGLPQGHAGNPMGQQGGLPVAPQKRPAPFGGEQVAPKQQRQGAAGVVLPPGAYPSSTQNAPVAPTSAPASTNALPVPGTTPVAGGQPVQPLPTPGSGGGQTAAAPAAPPQAAAKDTYVVFTCGNDREEVVVRTLVGEYVEKGVNHGRKVYQKQREKAAQSDYVDVLLYYWDSRDGPAFEGWWFGNKLGGTQVWSHCKDSSLLPPGAGWKIPWDGGIRQTLVVMNKEVQQKAEAEEKLQQLSAELGKAAVEVNSVMGQARMVIGDGSDPEGMAEAEKMLQPQVPVLAEMARKVAEAQKTAVGDTIKSFQQLSDQMKKIQDTLNNEHSGIRNTRQKAEQDKKQKAEEERDTIIFDELIPEATDKTNIAEDMVEKTLITSEMISACGDDASMVRSAIEETEKSGKAAQAAIGEARIYLNAKLASTRRFTETVKERASAELGRLQQQLQDAQNRLNPLKTVRQTYEQRRAAQKLVSEVEEKIVMAEVDVDRAEEMVSLLHTDTPTKDGLQLSQRAIQTAEDQINQAMRIFESKKKSATGLSLEELSKLEPRGDASLKRIHQLRASLKEVGERVTTDGYLEEAAEKVQTVTDALSKLEDIEGRFQVSGDISLEETLEAVKSSEAAAGSAQTASSMARMFISMKVLEVKRFSSGPSTDATVKLQEYQKHLEIATQRLGELKGNISKRKRLALVREAETRVAKAEESVEKLKEAASLFADDEKLMAMTSEEIRVASEKTSVCEKEANEALMEVRKFVTARQIEAKSKDVSVEISSELIKFQARLSSAQTEVGKQRKLFTSVEQRLAVKRMFDESEKKLTATEEKVSKANAAVAGLAEFVPEGMDNNLEDIKENSDKAVKDAELSVQEAQIAVRTMERHLESQSRSQGYARDALLKLEPRMKEVKERTASVAVLIKERSEKIFVGGIIRDAQQKVSDFEENLKKAVEAELPLLQSDENDSDKNASTLVAELEKAIQVAQSAASSSKTFISMKRLSVKRLSEASCQTTNEALTKMHATIDDSSKKLAEMRSRFLELKKTVLRREAKGAGKAIGSN